MLSLAFSTIVYLIEMLIAYIVFSYTCEKKQRPIIVFLIGAAIFISGAVVNIVFTNTVWLNAVYTLFVIFFFAQLCFEIPTKTAALYAFLMSVFSVAFEFATIFIVSAIAGTRITDYNINLLLLVLETAVSKTLYFVACIIMLHFSRGKVPTSDAIPISFYLFPICTLFAFLAFWHICAHEKLSQSSQMLLAYTSVAFLVSTVLLFISYRHNIEKDNEYIRVRSKNKRLLTEKAYYDILEHQNQQLLLYAHDAKKHLTAIQFLSANPKINEYVSQLSSELKSCTHNCHSGNIMLDVLIHKYETECELRGLDFDYDVRQCNLSRLEDIDIVAILGNLMDNALTSAEQSSGKKMSIATTWRNSYNVIIISNSCDQAPVSLGKQLFTTKEDRKLHGFGLQSVKQALKKYHGDFLWEYIPASHCFIVTVMVGPI